MPARRCLSCSKNYPPREGEAGVHCPKCGKRLQYSSVASPDTEWPIADELPRVTAEVAAEIRAGWAWVQARKREGWSDAEAIEVFPKKAA